MNIIHCIVGMIFLVILGLLIFVPWLSLMSLDDLSDLNKLKDLKTIADEIKALRHEVQNLNDILRKGVK